jgi:hypothetical protein
LSEDSAFLGLGDGIVKDAFAGTNGGNGNAQSLPGEIVHGDGETLPFVANPVGNRDAHIGEEEF